jgi:hypothetical protein
MPYVGGCWRTCRCTGAANDDGRAAVVAAPGRVDRSQVQAFGAATARSVFRSGSTGQATERPGKSRCWSNSSGPGGNAPRSDRTLMESKQNMKRSTEHLQDLPDDADDCNHTAPSSVPPSSCPSGADDRCMHVDGFECRHCGAQVVGADAAAPSTRPSKPVAAWRPEQRHNWPVDDDGFAAVTVTGQRNGVTATLLCFTDYLDPVTGERRPFHPKDPILYKDRLFALTGYSPAAFKEVSAHLPGRVPFLHEVACFTDIFMREFYWPREHRRRARRVDRKAAIKRRHTAAGCTDFACRQRHK